MDLNDSTPSDGESPSDILICGFTEECDFRRFLSITALSAIALCGVFNNGLLAWVFMKHKCPTTPPTLYPTFLAVMDGLICCFYIFLFGFDVVMIYLRIESLFVIYHTYIVPAFVLSKITQLAIPYLLIFVTLERYAWISEHMKNFCLFSTKGRPISVICCLLMCVCLRSPPLWALTVDVYPDCPDFFRSLAVAPHAWVMESDLYAFYDFWLMAFIQTLLPFLVLVVTNIIIVKRLSAVHAIEKKHIQKIQEQAVPPSPKGSTSLKPFQDLRRTSMKKLSFSRIRMPQSVRNAVYTTLAIVASYLMCNSLHLILTVLERSKATILEDAEDPLKASTFYTFFGDSVSALYMVTSAIRILIYCKCNPVVKGQVLEALEQLCLRKKCHDDVTKIKPTQCFITIKTEKSTSLCPSEECPVDV